VLDALTFSSAFKISGHLTVEVAMQFSAQKAQDVFGAQRRHRQFHQGRKEMIQGGSILKKYIQ
jgi:hypothetical protein